MSKGVGLLALASVLAAGFNSPVHAVRASPPTCYPKPPCFYCIENEGPSGRCVKCRRKSHPRWCRYAKMPTGPVLPAKPWNPALEVLKKKGALRP